jgi:hypothetical protein
MFRRKIATSITVIVQSDASVAEMTRNDKHDGHVREWFAGEIGNKSSDVNTLRIQPILTPVSP